MITKKRNRVCLSLDDETKLLLDRLTFFTGASTSAYIVKLIEDAKPEIQFIVDTIAEHRNNETQRERELIAYELYYNYNNSIDELINKEKAQLDLIATPKNKVRKTTKKKIEIKK